MITISEYQDEINQQLDLLGCIYLSCYESDYFINTNKFLFLYDIYLGILKKLDW